MIIKDLTPYVFNMVVVRHLAVGVAHPFEPRTYLPKCFQPRETILVREINILSPITTRSDVIESAGEF